VEIDVKGIGHFKLDEAERISRSRSLPQLKRESRTGYAVPIDTQPKRIIYMIQNVDLILGQILWIAL